MKRTLDRESFDRAKVKCGLTEATFFTGGFGITLAAGQNAPTSEQQRKLDCMDRELVGFKYHVITESPPAQ
jgi:hypothetical protein